jgi:ABC-type multidrug transport system ATPase subunit
MKLECRDITYRYPNAENAVLNDLSFTIDRPGFHALFGPSGVGKTSLAKIITGLIPDFSGEMTVKGLDRRLFTYNFERLPDWSVVGRHLEKITPSGRESLKDELVDVFGLGGVTGKRFSGLSLGQKNRINLIRYLVQDFNLLVMDESLANVDEPMRETIILKTKALFPERCFLYISHNVSEVSKFCNRILVLRDAVKQPQAVFVSGRDTERDPPPETSDIEKTMLEVMNAS